MKLKIIILFLSLFLYHSGYGQEKTSFLLEGIILDQNSKQGIPGATIIVKGSNKGTVSDPKGDFSLELPKGLQTLTVSFIGYVSQIIEVEIPKTEPITIYLDENLMSLSEVQVVSTGFQEIPMERTTGSFAQVDEKLVNRRISTSVLDRLEDLTPGLIFNRDRPDLSPSENISIRGNSTLLSNGTPLIVVDNLVYDGPVENINPNDVESMTVLRDAAAASIWGARAGNGVIVIKTKSGLYNRPIQVSINSNFTVQESFDPFYFPRMQITDFVDKELELFENGFYGNREEAFGNPKLSAVVETLIANRDGELSELDLEQRILDFRNTDLRSDLQRYFYRPAFRQQYAVQLSGGGDNYAFSLGLGADNNRETEITNQNHRYTISLQQNFKALKSKLDFGLGLYLIQTNGSNSFPEVQGIDPYARLVGENGEALPVLWKNSSRFKQQLMGTGILDWDYYPFEELGMSPIVSKNNEIRINPRVSWNIGKGFKFLSNYQYWTATSSQDQIHALGSFFTRDLVNTFTVPVSGGLPTQNVPVGEIFDFSNRRSFSHTWRNQLDFTKTVNQHEFKALIGNEIRDFQSSGRSGRAYGYDDETGIAQLVNPLTFLPDLTTGFTNQIPFPQSFSGNVNRYVSYFSNIGYTFQEKYLFNASARVDASNLYGVRTNQQRVPLWSAGLGWILSEEEWVNWEALDFLKLKISYGFTGNTNPAATAFTTGIYFGPGSNRWVGEPWLSVVNPPNPTLRWEKIKIVNLGTEFEFLKGRLSGSLEVYSKSGIDLFGVQPIFPSLGVASVTRNYASTESKGADLNISARIIQAPLSWTAHFFYSHINEKVTNYAVDPVPTNAAVYSSGLFGIAPSPVEGFPIFSVFSFQTAELDPTSGAPRGIVEGQPSSDYSRILAETTMDDLIFHGSSIPTHFGALRNELGWKGIELSMNLTYRLGYYFRRESIIYDNLNRGEIAHSDYSFRWQNPGDELKTDIPSDPGTLNPQRNTFDQVSSRSVRKGDHIRLQDIRLSYTFGSSKTESLKDFRLEIYGYANNLGIFWKAAKDVRDPDFRNFQAPRSFSLGFRINY